MIKSMTGYGKAEFSYAHRTTTIEMKSLNSKQLDLNLKIAPYYKDKEADIRALMTPLIERGKVDVIISRSDNQAAKEEYYQPINQQALEHYYKELKPFMEAHNIPADGRLVAELLRMPDVLQGASAEESLNEEEAQLLMTTVSTALKEFDAFRIQEGAALQKMFAEKLTGIETLLAEVEPFENDRVKNIRERLLGNLQKLAEETQKAVDKNRLEAELIYYLEKLDITEEKVRLTNHIKYFRETMATEGQGVGKKLGFIAQEMGREINTLGSKSNQSQMQIIVVKMKDLLEQIKEQVLNVL